VGCLRGKEKRIYLLSLLPLPSEVEEPLASTTLVIFRKCHSHNVRGWNDTKISREFQALSRFKIMENHFQ